MTDTWNLIDSGDKDLMVFSHAYWQETHDEHNTTAHPQATISAVKQFYWDNLVGSTYQSAIMVIDLNVSLFSPDPMEEDLQLLSTTS